MADCSEPVKEMARARKAAGFDDVASKQQELNKDCRFINCGDPLHAAPRFPNNGNADDGGNDKQLGNVVTGIYASVCQVHLCHVLFSAIPPCFLSSTL